jgi:predicted nucleic acid-binding protein
VGRHAKTEPLRVCVDSDVLIAGLMSTRGASHAVFVLGELGLFTLVVPRAAVEEVRRNLRELLPDALPLFAQFLSCPAVTVCGGSTKDDAAAKGHADAKDIPILAAAIASDASLLVTHNTRHFRSTGEVRVLRPSALLEEARAWIATRGESE